MDPQTKNEIITKISSTATKNIEQAVRDSLKRVLPQEFLDKTTDETIKWIKGSTIPEFKSKGNKICYKANKKFSKKLMMLTIPLKKDTSRDAKKNCRKVRPLFLNTKN